jgi:hypothetical protein
VGTTAAVPFPVYAITEEGCRIPLEASTIVIDLGHAQVRIDLRSRVEGQLPVSVDKAGHLLVIRNADASSVHVSVETPKQLRARS